jgi:uncharacterized protein YkwD
MKTLILILNLIVFSSYSQILFVEGSDVALMKEINKYRVSNGITEIISTPKILPLLKEKLLWMTGRNVLSHNDPFDMMEKADLLISREYSHKDSVLVGHFAGECLHSGWVEINIKDTANAYCIIMEKYLDSIAVSTVRGWKNSPEHNSIVRMAQEFLEMGHAAIVVNLKDYDDSRKTRSYRITSIFYVQEKRTASLKFYMKSVYAR